MWIYTRSGSILHIGGVAEIKLKLNGANSELHVTAGAQHIPLAVGSEEAVRERYAQIKAAIEAGPDAMPTHLDFSQP